MTLSTHGGHTVILDDGKREVTVKHSGGSVITIKASGTIEVTSQLAVEVTAAMVKVTAPISTFTGVVKAQSVIADAFVVSPAYTPGVGNLL